MSFIFLLEQNITNKGGHTKILLNYTHEYYKIYKNITKYIKMLQDI